MNALSLFPGLCMLFASAFLGLWIKKRLISRAEFYEEYYSYLVYVSEKIGYERMPIAEIKSGFLAGKSSQFKDFLIDPTVSVPLSGEKLREIESYLASIGKTDADTQIASLGAKCVELKRYTENECRKNRKDASLYFKLSVLLGIAALIIFV